MSKQVTITLSDELIDNLSAAAATRKDRTFEELLVLCIERGAHALNYRTKYNKVKYERQRKELAAFKEWKASRNAYERALDK